LATANQTATASQHNISVEDLEADANTARPIVAGGTGATSASGARTNLGIGAAGVLGVTGADTAAVTGTAGTDGNLVQWNADGDAVDASVAVSAVATLTGTQTLTNKTLTSPTVNSPTIATPTLNIGSDATGDILYRSGGGGLTRLGVGSNGEVLTLASGVPTWAAAAAPTIARSSLNTFTGGGTITYAHGQGSEPDIIDGWLECVSGNANWSTGDRLKLPFSERNNTYNGNIYADATNIYFAMGSAGQFVIANKTSGASSIVTSTNFRIELFGVWF